jgi:hypothetical protein
VEGGDLVPRWGYRGACQVVVLQKEWRLEMDEIRSDVRTAVLYTLWA